MKTRVISSFAALALLALALWFFDTPFPNFLISLISLLAVWEILNATGCTESKTVTIFGGLLSVFVPFFSFDILSQHIFPLNYGFVLILFISLLRKHETLRIEKIAVGFMFSVLVPMSLATLLAYRDTLGTVRGIFYILVVLGCAWLGDTCAFFAGSAFGKHKLAPAISPKKTVEGAVGGIVGDMIFLPLLIFGYDVLCDVLGSPIHVYYVRLILFIPLGAVLGMMGDLSASVIKRQFNVKDFGSIMPGHGGVMDRFDSVLLIAPFMYALSGFVAFVG